MCIPSVPIIPSISTTEIIISGDVNDDISQNINLYPCHPLTHSKIENSIILNELNDDIPQIEISNTDAHLLEDFTPTPPLEEGSGGEPLETSNIEEKVNDPGLVLNELKAKNSERLIIGHININFLENNVTVQFDHRILGITTFILTLVLWFYTRIHNLPLSIKKKANILLLVIIIQISLGVATLISHVATPIAIIHQLGALVFYTISIWTLKSLPFMSK